MNRINKENGLNQGKERRIHEWLEQRNGKELNGFTKTSCIETEKEILKMF